MPIRIPGGWRSPFRADADHFSAGPGIAIAFPGTVSLSHLHEARLIRQCREFLYVLRYWWWRLEGTVQDESGAVVAGTRVTAVNNKTQVRSEITSGAEGRYVLPSLPPGDYTVTVDTPGFRKSVVNNVVLNVSDAVVRNIKLEVGQMTESVQVEAEAVRVRTSESQISRVVTMRDIDTLPQLGRNPLIPAVFQPGGQIDAGDTSYSRVNGLRQGSNNTKLDGVDVNDPVAPRLSLSHNATNPDSLGEFRIIINGGKAEYGRSADGQVEMITRSGTNRWSGNRFEYLRNRVFHANNFFNNATGNARPKYIQNQFDVGDTLNTAGFRFNAPSNSFNDQFTIKADHNLTSAHRLFFRYSWFRTQSIDTTNSYEATFPGQVPGVQGGNRWGYSIGSDWSLTPTIVNEARFGFREANTDFVRPARPKGIAYLSNLYTNPIAAGFSSGRNSPIYDITENVTMVRQKHTFKGGANLRFTLQHGWRDDGIYPNVTFATTFGNNVPAGIGPAGGAISSGDRQRFESLYNDVLGRMNQVTQTFYSDLEKFLPAGTSRVRDLVIRESGYFIQDDWKIRRNLTLNLGLRYEFFGIPSEKDKLMGVLDKADLINTVSRISDLKVRRDNTWFASDRNNFAPRFGFAWDVRGDGKTALRGGYGVFYDRIIGSTLNGATPALRASRRRCRCTPTRMAQTGARVMARRCRCGRTTRFCNCRSRARPPSAFSTRTSAPATFIRST